LGEDNEPAGIGNLSNEGASIMADRDGKSDPFRSYRFRIQIDGIDRGGFRECSGLDFTQDPVDYREGTDPLHTRKLPGLQKFSNIVLKWGLSDDQELYDWRKQAMDGKIVRKNGSIVLLDDAGDDVALAAGVLLVLHLPLGLADALDDDLLGGLRRDAAKALDGVVQVQQIAVLRLLLGRAIGVAVGVKDLKQKLVADLGAQALAPGIVAGDVAPFDAGLLGDNADLEKVNLASLLVELRL